MLLNYLRKFGLFAVEKGFGLQSEAMKQDIQVRQYIPRRGLIQFIFLDEGIVQGIIQD